MIAFIPVRAFALLPTTAERPPTEAELMARRLELEAERIRLDEAVLELRRANAMPKRPLVDDLRALTAEARRRRAKGNR